MEFTTLRIGDETRKTRIWKGASCEGRSLRFVHIICLLVMSHNLRILVFRLQRYEKIMTLQNISGKRCRFFR